MGGDKLVRVLVVEDEPLLRMHAVDILEDAGFAVIEARDGTEALLVLKAVPGIHVLMTDVNMPGEINGFTLAIEIFKDRPEIGIVIVSGCPVPEQSMLPARTLFLAKPYEARHVVSHIHKAATRE